MSLELHHDFTFNPDGSGRVHVRWSCPGGAGAPSPDAFVRSELERAVGVEAWADVRCEPEGDQLVFEAVAWFRDPQQLRFHCQGFHVSLLDFEVVPQPDGGVAINTLARAGHEAGTTLAADADAAEVARALAAEREKLGMAREFLAGMFGELHCTAVVRAPGPLVGDTPGERLDDRTVRVAFAGSELVAALERLMTDDDILLRLLRGGGVTPEAALAMLGATGPIRLRTGPVVHEQFDYEQEVDAARATFAPLAESLQAALPSTEPAWPLTNVRVVATRIVLEADADRDLCPQGQNQPGLELTVAGDLDRAALEIDEVGFEQLLASDGTDLTPPDEWERRCHFPKRTNDGATVYLDLKLPLPAGPGFALLQGRLMALVSSGSESVDLQLPELVEGASSEIFGARILRLQAEDDGSTALELQLQVPRARVLGCDLHQDGAVEALTATGYSSCNDQCDLSWRATGTINADARLVLTCAADLARVPFSFELRDFDPCGRPLASP
ncbi:MAG: hypothetical protein MUC36_15885 [Planctomycetes bacterium]|jgi:hypothetical protein|nr:hypothetical protein [Planctomycetota bacterium]